MIAPTETPKLDVDNSEEKRPYLYGLRGILALCSIATVFFQTFVPALVREDLDGPKYQNLIRIVFSPIFWDEQLICSFFFALSSYAIALRFLHNPVPSAFSGSIIRRVFRMILATAPACGIVFGIFGGMGTENIEHFQIVLPNPTISAPDIPQNALVGLNAIFDLFWAVRDYSALAANTFWPTHTLWNLSLIFNQSWTIYFLMVILPYCRPSWHSGALAMFAGGSFWACSWGWYNAAALVLADHTVVPQLRSRLDEGLAIRKSWTWKMPYVLVAAGMMIAGFAMKFAWAVLPQYYDKELVLRPFLHLSEETDLEDYASSDAYPRLDNALVIFGTLLLTERSVLMKRCLSYRPLVLVGKRSLSKSYHTKLFYRSLVLTAIQAYSSHIVSCFGRWA